MMRLTDDYLLMTTNKNNAMLVIEQLQKLSNTNYFKMNLKKLKTSFPLNLKKIGCTKEDLNDLTKQNIPKTPKPLLNENILILCGTIIKIYLFYHGERTRTI